MWSRRAMQLVGVAILALSAFFMVEVLVRAWRALEVTSLPIQFWLGVALGGLVFAIGTLLLAVCWHELARGTGARYASWRVSWLIYARSVPLKYVPGNILHLAGRQVMGASRGYGHATLAAASVLEIASLASAAAIVATSALGTLDPAAFGVAPWLLWSVPLVAAGVLLAAPFVVRRLTSSRADILAGGGSIHFYGRLIAVLVGHFAFFLASGATTATLLWILDPAAFSAARGGWVVLAYAGAWIVGFVAPGAPAGLGVREAVFVVLAATLVPEPLVVLISVGARIANILGDALFYLVSEALARRSDGALRGRGELARSADSDKQRAGRMN